MNGRSAQGLWEGPHLMWHINCLEMLAVFKALKYFLPDLRGHRGLVRTDNTSVVSYINHQGVLLSRPLYRLACQILLWAQGKLLSLRAVYIPGTSIKEQTSCPERGWDPGNGWSTPRWWSRFGRSLVEPRWTCLRLERPHNVPSGSLWLIQLPWCWPRLRLYTFPLISLLPEVLERVRRDKIPRTGRPWFADLVGLLEDSPWEIPVWRDLLSQAGGTIFYPRPELWKLWVWPLRDNS